jgi:hypothetical protein
VIDHWQASGSRPERLESDLVSSESTLQVHDLLWTLFALKKIRFKLLERFKLSYQRNRMAAAIASGKGWGSLSGSPDKLLT